MLAMHWWNQGLGVILICVHCDKTCVRESILEYWNNFVTFFSPLTWWSYSDQFGISCGHRIHWEFSFILYLCPISSCGLRVWLKIRVWNLKCNFPSYRKLQIAVSTKEAYRLNFRLLFAYSILVKSIGFRTKCNCKDWNSLNMTLDSTISQESKSAKRKSRSLQDLKWRKWKNNFVFHVTCDQVLTWVLTQTSCDTYIGINRPGV